MIKLMFISMLVFSLLLVVLYYNNKRGNNCSCGKSSKCARSCKDIKSV